MIESHKEFFQKLSKLCEEYAVTILDSGSVRKGIEVTFSNKEMPGNYEKFSVDEGGILMVVDENGEKHFT